MEGQREYLDTTVKRLAVLHSVPVTSALLESPAIAETLNAHAATTGADLIVMTTHGRGPLSRFWLGSVADELVRRATIPILLVRPQEKAPDLSSEPILRHILIPLDGSALAEQALEPALALGKLMEADYTLVRIYFPLAGDRHGKLCVGGRVGAARGATAGRGPGLPGSGGGTTPPARLSSANPGGPRSNSRPAPFSTRPRALASI